MVFRFLVSENSSGQRIDHFIVSQKSDLSRGFIRKIIDLGGVHAAGRRIRKCSYAVNIGESIEVYIDNLPLDIFTIQPSDVLYRDKFLIAINKPSGIETQPTPARFKGTLYESLSRYLADPFRPMSKPSLGMVQRLDRDTSGVIVFSIHPQAHKTLSELFGGRRIRKTYLALVEGTPSKNEGEIVSLLARTRANNLMKTVERGGKEAITRYKVLRRFNDATLLEIDIPTGRSHQIRVHMAENGHPLLGDTRYGGPLRFHEKDISRHMLHAWRLVLDHPVTGQPLVFEAPVPKDMETLMRLLQAPEHPPEIQLS